MNDLYKLINELGKPEALIDHWDHYSKQFGIWGFDETFEITNNGIALINDKKYTYTALLPEYFRKLLITKRLKIPNI